MKNIYFIIHLSVCLLMLPIVGLGQSKLFVGGNLSGGIALPSATLDGQNLMADYGLNLGFRGEFGMNFSPNLGLSIGLGYRQARGSFIIENWAVPPGQALPSSVFYLEDVNGDRLGNLDYSRLDTISLTETITSGRLQVPLMLELKTNSFFLSVGPVLTFAPGGIKYSGTGEVDYAAIFPELKNLTLGDVPGWFETVSMDMGEGNTASGIGIDLAAQIGYRKVLTTNGALMVGLSYVYGGNEVSSPSQSVFYNQPELSNRYRSITTVADKLSFQMPGLFVAYRQGLGEAISPDPKPDCLPQDVTTLQVLYEQSSSSRREATQNDPEFNALIQAESGLLSFEALNWDASNSLLTYCSAKQTASSILPHFPVDHAHLDLRNAQPDFNENLILEFNPRNQIRDLQLQIQDEFGNPVSDYEITFMYENETLFKGRGQDGIQIPPVYAHPAIQYEVRIVAPCYQESYISLNESQIRQTTVPINLQGSGAELDILLPLFFNSLYSTLSGTEIFGDLEKDGGVYPLKGIAEEGRINYEGACGPDLSGRSSILLKKPKGYDLYYENEQRLWKIPTLNATLTDGESRRIIYMAPLKEFHFFYLNLPTDADKQNAQALLKAQFLPIINDEQDVYLYMSDPSFPISIEQSSDLQFFANDLTQNLPEGSNILASELERLKNDNDPFNLVLGRRIAHFYFYMPAEEYRRDQQAIQELLDYYGKDLVGAKVHILTDGPVAEDIRVDGAVVEYGVW